MEFAAYETQETGCAARFDENVREEQRLAQLRAIVLLGDPDGIGVDEVADGESMTVVEALAVVPVAKVEVENV